MSSVALRTSPVAESLLHLRQTIKSAESTGSEQNAPWTNAAFLALAATALGHAIQIADGDLGTAPYPAIAWLTIAIILAGLGLFLRAASLCSGAGFRAIVCGCVLANVAQLFTKLPDHFLGPHHFYELTPFALAVLGLGLCSIRVLGKAGAGRGMAFVAALIVVAGMGRWTITNNPDPKIDVFLFQQNAADALDAGHNPYAISIPQIYPASRHVYGDGIVNNGRVEVGYPYLPETLLAIMPTRWMHIDLRYAQLAAILASAVGMVLIDGGAVGYSAALLFITTPRLCYVLEKSWTEPFGVLALVATVLTARRWPRGLPLALGLFLASKQYAPIAAILLFAGDRPIRQRARTTAIAIFIALAVNLPLALWNLHAFWRSAVVWQFKQPFREDSLSYLALMGEAFWPHVATVAIPFGALILVIGLLLWRRSNWFSPAVALSLVIFFACSKQAFANYYFFIAGALACGVVEVAVKRPIPETGDV